MLVTISMMFHEDILNGFQVTERTALFSVLGIAIFFLFKWNNFESAKSVTKGGFLHTHFDKLS